MPVRPYTFALRGLYYGRYGSDAEDPRLPTMYLGYPGLVRGYDPDSFEAGECGTQTDGSCPVFDRLIGSRVAIANAELRFPLWGAFGGEQLLRTAAGRARRLLRRGRGVGRHVIGRIRRGRP